MAKGRTTIRKVAYLNRFIAAISAMRLRWKSWTLGEVLINAGLCISVVALCAYFISMVVLPWFEVDADWEHVQRIWHSWQALNVGMIALASSLLAFYSARYSSTQKRKHEHIAAVAFLPHALSALTQYFLQSAKFLTELYGAKEGDLINIFVPPLPVEYKKIFYRCIIGADNDLAGFLSSILNRLQIHHSRITRLETDLKKGRGGSITKGYVVVLMAYLAEIDAMISKLYDYARFNDLGYKDPLKVSNYIESCAGLEMDPEIKDLLRLIDSLAKDYNPREISR